MTQRNGNGNEKAGGRSVPALLMVGWDADRGEPPRGKGQQAPEGGDAPPPYLAHLDLDDPSAIPAMEQGLEVMESNAVPVSLLKHRILDPEEEYELLRAYHQDGDE